MSTPEVDDDSDFFGEGPRIDTPVTPAARIFYAALHRARAEHDGAIA